MIHVNIKPVDKTRVYETPNQAIQHVFLFNTKWDFGGRSFAETIADRRKLQAALKAKRTSAFTAAKRGGYWRVELK